MGQYLVCKTAPSLPGVEDSSSPLCPMLTSQQNLLKVKIMITNIHVNRIRRSLDGTIWKYAMGEPK
jgi:hypothetical protein